VNKDLLKEAIGVAEGSLLTRYLCLPLTIHYPKAKDYTIIVDKCRTRIEGCMSATLSFSGRVELIKTVILGTLQYWIQTFKFPKSIIKAMESIFAKFLWRNKIHEWAWEKICKPKAGGLAKVNL